MLLTEITGVLSGNGQMKYTTGYSKAILKESSKVKWPVRSPFGYYGAKVRIAKQIIKNLPPHNAWVEAFCGSAAITLAKKPAPIEVINDRDDQIVNVFKQLRSNSTKLINAIKLTPYARAEYEKATKFEPNLSSLEKARRFLVATMMTVNGTLGSKCGFSYAQSYARSGKEARVNRWYNLPDRLEEVVARLRCIRIENRDARTLLSMFDNRPATLVYLDPPYFIRRDHGYTIDAKDEDFHIELLEICQRAKCMILLSGYRNDLYLKCLTRKNGWTRIQIDAYTKNTAGRQFPRSEILWKNDKLEKALRTGRVPIRLTKEEKRNGKINPVRD